MESLDHRFMKALADALSAFSTASVDGSIVATPATPGFEMTGSNGDGMGSQDESLPQGSNVLNFRKPGSNRNQPGKEAFFKAGA